MTLDPTRGAAQRPPVVTPASLAESLAPSARVLLLVHRHRPDLVDDDPALELAEAIGHGGRPTLFLDLARPRSIYSDGTNTARSPGLSDVLRGTATFVDVTVRDPRRSFMYVPRGGGRREEARLLQALADSPVLERAGRRDAVVLLSVTENDLPARTDGLPFDGAVLIGDADPPQVGAFGGEVPALARLPGGAGEAAASRTERGAGRTWPRPAESPRAPASPAASRPLDESPSEVVFPSGAAAFREARPNGWFVLLLCVLAAALGMSILSAMSEDSWLRDMVRPSERPAATSQR